jgi:hypothetical protein
VFTHHLVFAHYLVSAHSLVFTHYVVSAHYLVFTHYVVSAHYLVFTHHLVSTQYLVRTLRLFADIAAHARSPVLIGQVDAALSELRRATKRRIVAGDNL